MIPVTLNDIRDAAARIAGKVARTPLRLSPTLSDHTGREVRLKLETMQDTGAFKIRGATNALLAMAPGERARGVIAVSTGNHGRAVAFAAHALGVKCSVYMSDLVPDVKVRAIKALGAEVVIAGHTQDEAEAEALPRIERDGITYVHPFDDPHVIAGQGTIGLEILEDMPDVANVLVPLSGGGLFAGIATAIKTLKPEARLIGISMDRGAAMVISLAEGTPTAVEEVESLADSLGGGIGLENKYTFKATQRLIDQTVLLSEDEIADGMRALYRDDRIVAEGGGAVGVGALVADRADLADGPTAVVVSGCNVDMDAFEKIIGSADQ